jgi:hypothetical protein
MGKPGDKSWPDKGVWVYPEYAVKMLFWVLMESGIGFVIVLLLWLRYGSWPFLVGGAVIGSFVIWRIVRWVNRRDDPRVKPAAPNPDPDAASGSTGQVAP